MRILVRKRTASWSKIALEPLWVVMSIGPVERTGNGDWMASVCCLQPGLVERPA